MSKQYQDKDWLKEQYVEKGKTMLEIADECGVSDNAIFRWVHRFSLNKFEEPINPLYKDKEWLHYYYLTKDYSLKEIAEICNTTDSTISRWTKKHKLDKKDYYAHDKESLKDLIPLYVDKDWLYNEYVSKGKTLQEIADICNSSISVVSRWKTRHNIERKKRS